MEHGWNNIYLIQKIYLLHLTQNSQLSVSTKVYSPLGSVIYLTVRLNNYEGVQYICDLCDCEATSKLFNPPQALWWVKSIHLSVDISEGLKKTWKFGFGPKGGLARTKLLIIFLFSLSPQLSQYFEMCVCLFVCLFVCL